MTAPSKRNRTPFVRAMCRELFVSECGGSFVRRCDVAAELQGARDVISRRLPGRDIEGRRFK